MAKVLIIVDMQKDFMDSNPRIEDKGLLGEAPLVVETWRPALPVPGSLAIVPNIVKEAYDSTYDLVIATRDFHPATHSSFKEVGGEWPMHCVAGSEGAQLLPEIDMVADIIISKGTDADFEAYSGFDTTYNTLSEIILGLQEPGDPAPEVVVCGVATEYCVKATAYGAFGRGFMTTVLLDCIAGVDKDAADDAIIEMSENGKQRLSPVTGQYGLTLRTRVQ